jgi:hypothetical protein
VNIRLTSEAEATGVAELLEKPDFSKAEALGDCSTRSDRGDQVQDGAARAKNNKSSKDSGQSKPSFRGSEQEKKSFR